MFLRSFLVAALGCSAVSAFAPSANFAGSRHALPSSVCARRAPLAMRMQSKIDLTPELFTNIDTDASGTIDANELRNALGKLGDAGAVNNIMERADVNGDGEISYDEYVRLMNMEKFGDDQGGNLFVRKLQGSGALPKDSVLGYTAMVGNKGFDPLGLAGLGPDETTLNGYREAEIKHGRLAMLAALGWPVAEELQPFISQALGKPDLLVAGKDAAAERVPSLLNGGLENISPAFFAAGIVFSAAIELLALQWGGKVEEGEYQPGDLGFDPLGLYRGKDESTRFDLRLKELNNGRLAMIAISWYAFEEFFTGRSILENAGINNAVN